MAQSTLRFFEEQFDLDIIKIMPDIPYPFPHKSIRDESHWRLIEPIDQDRARFFTQRAESVRVIRDHVGYETPIIMTMFSPLCEALYFAESHDQFLRHAREHPAIVHEALSTIAENLRNHIADVIDAGADGVFFALQGCTTAVMPVDLYKEFGRPYDLMALQGGANGWLNVLHIHGDRDLMFDEVIDYPAHVLSWSDRIAGPSLREARGKTSKCLMGGWNERGAIAEGPVDKIAEEARDAVAQTAGRRFILANGCSVPDETNPEWLYAARTIADELEID
jgi:uroporphyrinogen decarboxylase